MLAVVAGLRARARPAAPAGTWLALATLAFLSRLTHELAFTLMAIPAAGLVRVPDARRALDDLRNPRHPRLPSLRHPRPCSVSAAALGIGLVAGQAVLCALHFLMPPGEGGGER